MAEENEKAALDRKAQEHEMNELKRRIHAAAEAIRSKLLNLNSLTSSRKRSREIRTRRQTTAGT